MNRAHSETWFFFRTLYTLNLTAQVPFEFANESMTNTGVAGTATILLVHGDCQNPAAVTAQVDLTL